MTSLIDLQKALDKKADENSMILYNVVRGFEYGKGVVFPSGIVAHIDSRVILLNDVPELFSVFQKDYEKQMARLKIAEEKNVEYAKLVAAQAEEYAEKNSVFHAKETVKEQSLRKLIEDFEEKHNNGGLIEVWKCDFDDWKKKVFDETFPISKSSSKDIDGSGEDLNLALAFSDVKMKKKGSGGST